MMSYCLQSLGVVPISQFQPQSLFHCSQSHVNKIRQRLPCSRLQEMEMEMSVVEPPSSQQSTSNYYSSKNPILNVGDDDDDDDDGDDEVGISKIKVPRQKHIPVSKSQLVDAILSTMFNQQQHHQDMDMDAHHFRLLTSCLDSILHAEHKSILEEMRSDYHLTNSDSQLVPNPNGIGIEDDQKLYDYQDQREKPTLSNPGLDLNALLRSLDIPTKKDYDRGSRLLPNQTHTVMPF